MAEYSYARRCIMEFEIGTDLYKRKKHLYIIQGISHGCEIIRVLTGVRRCGKSSILNLIAGERMASGVKAENLLCFDPDKKPYARITPTTPSMQSSLRMKKVNGTKYLFMMRSSISAVTAGRLPCPASGCKSSGYSSLRQKLCRRCQWSSARSCAGTRLDPLTVYGRDTCTLTVGAEIKAQASLTKNAASPSGGALFSDGFWPYSVL